jgi:glycosyltransferase involved in cell wall biosynthesis
VNITNTGLLAILSDALTSLSSEYRDTYEIIALVHRKSLFDIPGIEFLEYPNIKTSWSKRLYFEYFECRGISERIKPHLWFAMHDITPNVRANIRAVYCHNPTPFYSPNLKEFLFDRVFGVSTFLYRFLYGINIRSNDFVVVQQDWIRKQFQKWYQLGKKIIVAHPSIAHLGLKRMEPTDSPSYPYRFFYPAFPRPFKNFDQLLSAVRLLEKSGFSGFEVWITTDGTESPYAASLLREYADLTRVRWAGILPRTEVVRLHNEADCLVFPSKLETWGMPITEFKSTGKPILAADLPYAHETVGDYAHAAFFEVGNDVQLASLMRRAAEGDPLFGPVKSLQIPQPFAQNWPELWKMLLGQ